MRLKIFFLMLLVSFGTLPAYADGMTWDFIASVFGTEVGYSGTTISGSFSYGGNFTMTLDGITDTKPAMVLMASADEVGAGNLLLEVRSTFEGSNVKLYIAVPFNEPNCDRFTNSCSVLPAVLQSNGVLLLRDGWAAQIDPIDAYQGQNHYVNGLISYVIDPPSNPINTVPEPTTLLLLTPCLLLFLVRRIHNS